MEDWKERVVKERDDLNGKIRKLTDFLYSERSKDADPTQVGLMTSQLQCMLSYSNILSERLSAQPGHFE